MKKIYNLKDYVVYPKHGVGKITAIEKANIGEIDIHFYKILVELKQNYFESKQKTYYLVPGVKVTASIQIGERTLANYLLSPFIGSLGQSFQER